MPKAERLAKAREILDVVGLEDVESSFPDLWAIAAPTALAASK